MPCALESQTQTPGLCLSWVGVAGPICPSLWTELWATNSRWKIPGWSLVSCPRRGDHSSEITPWGGGTGEDPLFAEGPLGASALPHYLWGKRVKNWIFGR